MARPIRCIVFSVITFVVIAAICSCRRKSVDMAEIIRNGNPNLPSVKTMNDQVAIGMTREQVTVALGMAFSGGGTDDYFEAVFQGKDGSIGIIFKRDKVTDIQPMPAQNTDERIATKRLAIHEGMSHWDVWKALGKPNRTSGDTTAGITEKQMDYNCRDGTLSVQLKNDHVVGFVTH